MVGRLYEPNPSLALATMMFLNPHVPLTPPLEPHFGPELKFSTPNYLPPLLLVSSIKPVVRISIALNFQTVLMSIYGLHEKKAYFSIRILSVCGISITERKQALCRRKLLASGATSSEEYRASFEATAHVVMDGR